MLANTDNLLIKNALIYENQRKKALNISNKTSVEIKGIKKLYNYFCPTQCRILACHQFGQFEQLIADIFVENTFEADL